MRQKGVMAKETWTDRAFKHIAQLDAELGPDASYEERRAALRAGYPFGERKGWRYQAWLTAQREYLSRHDNRPLTQKDAPLFFWGSLQRPKDISQCKI